MEICFYEDWMKPQVISLQKMEYNVNEKEFEQFFNNFYNHPYQKNKCVRVVAKEDDKIVGFQTFFYWPYVYNNEVRNSYQSGKSLVHPDFRGKGLFQQMLNYIDLKKDELKIDFLMGFPVEQSRKSFLRNNWENILDLKWYLKFVNPFAFLFSLKDYNRYFDLTSIINNDIILENNFRLSTESEFADWRKGYIKQSEYAYFNYSEGENKISFYLKSNKRKSWLNELVVGDVKCSTKNVDFIIKGFKKLRKRAFSTWRITAITIAINEDSNSFVNVAIKRLNYWDTKKTIYFIVKPFIQTIPINKKENWTLYRSDIDTW